MRIAVNTRFLLKGKMEGFGWFTWETIRRIVAAHPEHQFIFFFDRAYDRSFIAGPNVEAVVLRPQARHPILFRIWFNLSVTRALKKCKADIFLSPDGYLSLKTNVPQIAVIHDLNFEHHPEDLPKGARNYLRKYFPLFAKKAAHIITVSEFSKQDVAKTYGIDPTNITVAHNGSNEIYKPVSESAQQNIRNTISSKEEFFIYVGSLHARKNIPRLLQAFDEFKSKTNSQTKLVITGQKLWSGQEPETTLKSLKHANDVIFTGYTEADRLAQYVASAKALVLVSYFEGFGIPIVEAMQCGTPVLCGNLTSLPEVAGDAAVLADPMSVTSIAEGLEKIDNDEILWKNLRSKGLERARLFSWDRSAEIIWTVIDKALERNKSK